MQRDIIEQLKAWQNSSRRKPLVLEGARQVGKTYALRYFGKSCYTKVAYFNFEREDALASYFSGELNPADIIKKLELHADMDITPGDTLIIFDEIQDCPKALTSLKYFNEEANQYHIATAGSLLGIKTAKMESFPVGKVNFLNLYPLSFFEFLDALGESRLRKYLEDLKNIEPIPEPQHQKLIELLKYYYYIGGMPEAVKYYAKDQNLADVREIHYEILKAYERDFSKHAPANQIMKIVTVWEQVHQQLAKENKKFIFSAIKNSARGREYEEAIQWLVDAGLVMKCYHVETPKLPINSYSDHNIFKLYLLDVGLLGAQSNLSAKTIIENHAMFTEFKGALTENFVAQTLKAKQQNLYYWTSPGTAEVDFIIEQEQKIIPIEVKAGIDKTTKSLQVYASKYQPETMLRYSLRNYRKDGQITNVPLYLITD